jgi:hypothetical protein
MATRGRKQIKLSLDDHRQISAIVSCRQSVRSIINAFSHADVGVGGGDQAWARRKCHVQLHASLCIETPHGTVARHEEIVGVNKSVKVVAVNPAAFLHHALISSNSFLAFISNIQRSRPEDFLRVIIYMDKARPGNQHRFDPARNAQCCYWAFLDVPHWFRSRRAGWMPFMYLLDKDQQDAALSDAAVVKYMARSFKPLEEGIHFQLAHGIFTLRCRIKICLADWEQIVKWFGLTGYHGSVPCGSICRNVVGRCSYFEDDAHLLHLHSHDYEKQVHHTFETLAATADHIKHLAQHGTAEDLALEVQATGLKYDKDDEGILFDVECRNLLRPPECQYFDWQHTMVASGGVFQYSLNQLLRQFVLHGVAVEDLDAWAET